MDTSLRIPNSSRAVALGLVLCLGGGRGALADPPVTPTTAPANPDAANAQSPAPQVSFFSALRQAIKHDYDSEVVRGHFEVGSPPSVHRYYCLVDPKTGRRESSGVAGELVPRADGMTGIKGSAVSVYSCVSAEQQGTLVTAGYLLSGSAAGNSAGNAVPPPAAPSEPRLAAAPSASADKLSADKIDVAGVRLGMSPDEVRAILKSKNLIEYYESTDSLDPADSSGQAAQPVAKRRFVNRIASWSPPPDGRTGEPQGQSDTAARNGESYEVMFTPVPGKERAMAIVHSMAYSAAGAIRETALDQGLVKKYGGFSASADVPASPTWRIQSGGNVLVGDACNRRTVFGGLGAVTVTTAIRPNLALNTTPDEFRLQIDRCGVAIVTEDHLTANADAPREDRMVTRFTVTAYSPSIGFEGATTAAQLIQAAGAAVNQANASRAQGQSAPSL